MGVFFMNWKIQALLGSGAFYSPSYIYQSLWTLQWQRNVLWDLHYISDKFVRVTPEAHAVDMEDLGSKLIFDTSLSKVKKAVCSKRYSGTEREMFQAHNSQKLLNSS